MFAGCVIQAGRNEAFDHTLKTLKTSGVEQRPPVLGVPPSLPSSTLDPQSLGGRVGPTSGMFPAGRPTAPLSPKLLCPTGECPVRRWGGPCETRVLGHAAAFLQSAAVAVGFAWVMWASAGRKALSASLSPGPDVPPPLATANLPAGWQGPVQGCSESVRCGVPEKGFGALP